MHRLIFILIVIGMSLTTLVTLSTFADPLFGTKVEKSPTEIRAIMDGPDDSRLLYQALKVAVEAGPSGPQKSLASRDGRFQLVCAERTGDPQCVLVIRWTLESVESYVTHEKGYLLAHLEAESDTQALFDALDVPAWGGPSVTSKTFRTLDRKARLQCYRRYVPGASSHLCSVAIFEPAFAD